MTIISVSINDTFLKEVDTLQKDMGFSGRSEVIRTALRLLLAQEKESSLQGHVEGVLIVVNKEKDNDEVSKIRHNYNHIIRTQVHNHLDSHKCLQLFVLQGESEKVKEFVDDLRSSGNTEYVKLVVS